MRRIVTAREQVALLSPWGTRLAGHPDDDVYGQRIRDLNRRRALSRLSPDNYPPLSDEEDAERQRLQDWSGQLREKYDNMEDMTPEEVDAHRQLGGKYVNGEYRLDDPETMDDHRKAEYFAGLHDYAREDRGSLTPRENHHYDTLQPWADNHFGNMHTDAIDELQRHNDFNEMGGQHLYHGRSLVGAEDAHHPDLTGSWASEMLRDEPTKSALYQRAQQYHDSLAKMADEGPLEQSGGRYHYQNHEDARNNLRVELQHQRRFKVPSTDELSPLIDPREGDSLGHLINPRRYLGLEGPSQGAKDAYKVNCQRCVLAAEARKRGHNVEAQANFQNRRGTKFNDQSFDDHGIASWFRGEDGSPARWTDTQDKFPHAPFNTSQWDEMHKDIGSWGPGARGAVAFSYPTPGGHARHIINTHVDDDGQVHYTDAQSGEDDASHWRDKVGYRMHMPNRENRKKVRDLEGASSGGEFEPDFAQMHNAAASPLRYLRTDDKTLSPETSQFMVDRGTARDKMIVPPDRPITPAKGIIGNRLDWYLT